MGRRKLYNHYQSWVVEKDFQAPILELRKLYDHYGSCAGLGDGKEDVIQYHGSWVGLGGSFDQSDFVTSRERR